MFKLPLKKDIEQKDNIVIGISVMNLYKTFGHALSHSMIDCTTEDGRKYYDLRDPAGSIVCMDGEDCSIISH